MITSYIIYLYTLPKEVQLEQILIIITFFFILLIICTILDFFIPKFFNKKDN